MDLTYILSLENRTSSNYTTPSKPVDFSSQPMKLVRWDLWQTGRAAQPRYIESLRVLVWAKQK